MSIIADAPYANAAEWCKMSEIITNHLCPMCSVYYRKNYDNSGDYDEDGRLLIYCPQCGTMHPPLSTYIGNFNLSRNERHNIGTRIAISKGIPYKRIHMITNSLRSVDDTTFITQLINHLSEEFNIELTIHEVLSKMRESGNSRKLR